MDVYSNIPLVGISLCLASAPRGSAALRTFALPIRGRMCHIQDLWRASARAGSANQMFLSLERVGGIVDTATGEVWDRTRLVQAVAERARRLTAAGIGSGAIGAILHGGAPAFFVDLLALWSVGAAVACLDPALLPSERANVIAFCRPAAILGEAEEVRTASARLCPCAEKKEDDPALILFTSGTTGIPKGVVLSFRALSARLALNEAEIGRSVLQRTLVTLPTHFGHGLIGNALTPLAAGGTIFLAPRGLSLASALGALLDEHAITFMSSVPSLWRLALPMSAPPRKGALRRIHIGSAPLSAALWSDVVDWAGCEVVNCYGTTETANWISGASSRNHPPADGFVGRPWGGLVALRISGGRIMSRGSGEIVVRTPSLMSGYLNRPDMTAAVMHDGWYATGDVGEVDDDGNIHLKGRIKDEINRAGFKVHPAELDVLLESHPSVAEACVFGIPDVVSGEIVAAAVRLRPDAPENASWLRDWCLQRLRREAVPEHWFFVGDIPRTESGKVNRDQVRERLMGTS
jgi:acyl-CoA synthetase (AMP-forming)/AMP-acid ligase II